jgi:hypothetical protein
MVIDFVGIARLGGEGEWLLEWGHGDGRGVCDGGCLGSRDGERSAKEL